jgi:hypothetical protein
VNVGGSFTDSGSATFAGVLTINGAGQFLLSSGSLTGGINGSGTFESVSGTTDTLGSITIYPGRTFTTTSGATTDISSGATIANHGTFVIDGTSGNAIVNLLGNVTLSGGGAVILKTKTGTAFLRGSSVTLTNKGNTIEGTGNIDDNAALTIVNSGTLNANASGQNLNVGQGGGGVTNTGTLEATGGGTLNLHSTITNTGGNITASGTNSDVNVQSTTIAGGTLNTSSGGLLQTVGTSTLNGVTIWSASTYTTADGATTDLTTSLTNDGTFLIDGSSGNAIVNLNNSVSLSGGGVVTMKTGAGTAFLRGSGVTLTNANDTIQGAGTIGDNAALAIANQATIDANASGQNLNLSQGGGVITNTGTLEATNGGTLNIFSKVTNTGGAITASGGAVNIDATITGGTLNATGTNVMETSSSADLVGVTLSTGSTYTTGNGATTQLDTSLTNDGTFVIDGSAGNAIVNLASNVTLSGGGVVTLKSNTGAAFLRGIGFTLTNTNNTIQGTGNIGDNGALTIVNQSIIDANASGQNLNLNAGGGSVTNTGTLEATNGGTLNISGTVTNQTGGVVTANGGTVNVIGKISGGTLNTLNGGVLESSGSGTILSGVTISSGSTYTAGPGSTTQINGKIVNVGTFAINGAPSNAIVNLGSAVTLSGKGKVIMSSGTGSAYLRGSGVTLTNTNDTIEGAGNIGDNAALAIVNKATIDANSKGQDLNVNQGNGGVTNTKTLEATAGGVLQLFNTITNTGGTITASGKGSTVNVDDATIVGGTLTTTKGGLMQTVGGSTLTGVTISTGSTYTTQNSETTDLNTSLTNDGTLLIDGSAGNAIVNLASNVTLSGGGTVTMKSKTGSAFLRGSGVTLTNTNDTIQGTGNIGDNAALTVANQATIDANASGQNLNVNFGNGGVTNTATLEATGGGVLQLFNTITNTGGAITASGTGSTVNVEGTIVGGTLNTASGGLMQTVSSADLHGVTISSGSTYTTAGATTQLDTALTNDGTFLIDGSASNAIVNLGSSVTLSGGGTVTMKSSSGTAFLRGSGVTLTNTNDTIQGAGTIGDNAALAIDNKGTIDANSSGQNLNLGQGGGALTNTGTFEATNGGSLNVFGALGGAGQLEIGANSTVQLGGATSENSTFLSATAATLLIDNATTTAYSGVINSFAKGDILELGNTAATTADLLQWHEHDPDRRSQQRRSVAVYSGGKLSRRQIRRDPEWGEQQHRHHSPGGVR